LTTALACANCEGNNSNNNKSNCEIDKYGRTLVNDEANNSSRDNNGVSAVDDNAKNGSRYKNDRNLVTRIKVLQG